METPDLALAILFVLTAAYAGAAGFFVAARRPYKNPIAVAAAVFALVAGYLFGVVLTVANVSEFVGLLAGVALLAAGCYLVLRSDLTQGKAIALTAGVTLVVGVASLFVSYLALISIVVTLSTYLVVRRWWETRQTLVVMGTAFGGLLAVSAVAFAISLSQM